MDILNLLGIGCHSASAVPGEQDGRGRVNYKSLSICIGIVPCAVSAQLGLPLHGGVTLRSDCDLRRHRSDHSLLRFLLSLHYQSAQRQKASAASIKSSNKIPYVCVSVPCGCRAGAKKKSENGRRRRYVERAR